MTFQAALMEQPELNNHEVDDEEVESGVDTIKKAKRKRHRSKKGKALGQSSPAGDFQNVADAGSKDSTNVAGPETNLELAGEGNLDGSVKKKRKRRHKKKTATTGGDDNAESGVESEDEEEAEESKRDNLTDDDVTEARESRGKVWNLGEDVNEARMNKQLEHQQSDNEMADVEEEKYELKKKIQTLEEQKEAIHKDWENSQAELKDLTTKLEQKSAQFRVTETKLFNANSRVKVLENEIDEAKTVIAEKDRVIAKKIEEASSKAKYAENSETETKQLREEIEEANEANRALKRVKATLDDDIQRLNSDLLASIGYRGERDHVMMIADDLKVEIANAYGQIEELQAELEGFKRRPNKADKALGRVSNKGKALGIELENLAGSDDDESEELGSVASPGLFGIGGSQKGFTGESSLGEVSSGGLDNSRDSEGYSSYGDGHGIATEESELAVISPEDPLTPTVIDTGAPVTPTVVNTGASFLSPMVIKIRHISPFILWIRVYYDIFILFWQWALQLQHWRSSGKVSRDISHHAFDLYENDRIAIVTKSPKTWVNIPQALLRSVASPEYEFLGHQGQQPQPTDLPELKFELKAVRFWDCFVALLAHILLYGVVAVCLYNYASLVTERGIWLQANELTRQALVQLRGQPGVGGSYRWTIFGQQRWFEVLTFNLVDMWLHIDQSFPG